ncbi:uncharacterized protein LOC122255288 [Penaeus japonicus]|uniref:uncharacterized protein LOC122255288 n=1 Tax=Penaeus japonicus TaxID=27405 RepID=UPI001C715DF7|nr:uncharacterized protein LOC122255288 [Penaeus japonicus]
MGNNIGSNTKLNLSKPTEYLATRGVPNFKPPVSLGAVRKAIGGKVLEAKDQVTSVTRRVPNFKPPVSLEAVKKAIEGKVLEAKDQITSGGPATRQGPSLKTPTYTRNLCRGRQDAKP